ncbi:hypothetical protein [Falsiroseomonas oryziterrae]|uniref:hypothetical protein n=1 Tax=Falsiroseomonas oryziterrae TaxID=2911368 RepID=UPI001F399814|nr:hypothetical protein [Roseomonas sp. NPKOSM-4]
MTTDPKRPATTSAAEAAKAEREARLAAALRENLRKRKAQARAREAPGKTREKAGETPRED